MRGSIDLVGVVKFVAAWVICAVVIGAILNSYDHGINGDEWVIVIGGGAGAAVVLLIILSRWLDV